MKLILITALTLLSFNAFAVEHTVPCEDGTSMTIYGNPRNLASQITHACDQRGGRKKSIEKVVNDKPKLKR
jgi:hypothetical protein